VAAGVIPKADAEKLVIVCGVFIHWDAADDRKIYDFKLQGDQGSDRRRHARQAGRSTKCWPARKRPIIRSAGFRPPRSQAPPGTELPARLCRAVAAGMNFGLPRDERRGGASGAVRPQAEPGGRE